MQSDDESQTTLSKWPFTVGDILLVGTALAIAILGGWQLTNWQVGACVAAVALGAALFTLPYIVEYQVRVREEREDRTADLRVLERHILNLEQTLSTTEARLQVLEDIVSDTEKPHPVLAELIDEKINQMETAHSLQEVAIQKLQGDLQELAKASQTAFDPEKLEPIEKRLQALEARPMPEAKVDEAMAADQHSASGKEKSAPERPQNKVNQIHRPKRSTRERHRPEESRLLRRAITEKGDNASAAVSRIIESKHKKKAPPELTPEKKPGKAKEAEDVVTEQKTPEEKVQVDAEMLFDEEVISSSVTRTKAKKNDAVVTASVFIGIGNKPYLRGGGGGLNWEQGQFMEFQEIGKWRWVVPEELDAPIEVQVFRNDEDPDTSGKYTLEPGQKLEVTPVF